MRPGLITSTLLATSLASALSRAAAPHPRPIDAEIQADLAAIDANLSALCADDCGSVALDPRPNAATYGRARLLPDNRAELAFNHQYLAHLRTRYGRSAVYFVVAHEYGHHLARQAETAWAGELSADALGGCALTRDGLDLEASIAFMRHEHFDELLDAAPREPNQPEAIVRAFRPSSHPPWLNRLAALRQGGEACRDSVPPLKTFLASVPQPPLHAGRTRWFSGLGPPTPVSGSGRFQLSTTGSGGPPPRMLPLERGYKEPSRRSEVQERRLQPDGDWR